MKRDYFGGACIAFGVLLILAGLIFPWHDAVLYTGYRAIGMPLLGGAVFPPPVFYPFSYGVVIVGLLLLAFVATRIRRPVAVAWVGFFFLLLALKCPLQSGYSQPSWLNAYLQGRNEYLGLTLFAEQASIPYMAPAIDSLRLADVEGLSDRMTATMVSMRVGWYFFLAGSVFFLAGALAFIPRWGLLRPQLWRVGWLLLIFFVWHFAGPVSGEFCWKRGMAEELAGRNESAKKFYQLALTLDPWNRYISRVYVRLGCIAEAQHHPNLPEYHLAEGMKYADQGNAESAMQEFLLAQTSSNPSLSRVASLLYGSVASAEATNLYSASGAAGSAASYWQKASRNMMTPVGQDYMAARGWQDSGQYNRALEDLTAAQKEAGDVTLQAQIFSSLGDVYYFRKDVAKGREEYLNSSSIMENYTEFKNLRAQKALSDNSPQ